MALIYSNFSVGPHASTLNLESISCKIVQLLINRHELMPTEYQFSYQFDTKEMEPNSAIPLGMIIGEILGMLFCTPDAVQTPCKLTIALSKDSAEYQLDIHCDQPLDTAILSKTQNPQSWEMINVLSGQLRGKWHICATPHSLLQLAFTVTEVKSNKTVDVT
jgi:hypothetical protein